MSFPNLEIYAKKIHFFSKNEISKFILLVFKAENWFEWKPKLNGNSK